VKVSRDVYGCHYEDLTETQKSNIFDLVALAVIESEEMK